jgi:hypothetical protein
MLGVTYAMAAIGGLRLPIDPDVWWHLRTGTWILEHKAVPFTDPFSAYGMGRPWIAYSWLFEMILLGLYRALGLLGVVAFAALGSIGATLALHVLISRYEKNVPRALALTLVGMAAMTPVFWPRSYLLSIVLFIVELHILLSVRDSGNPRALLVLPPLVALWANLHIQFVYGLFVLGVATAAPILERHLPEAWVGPRSRLGPRPLFVTLLASLVMTLATPYHVWIYRPLLDHIAQAGTFDLVNELHALLFRGPADWGVLGMTLGAAFVLGRRRGLPPFQVLLLCAGAVVSFRAARDVWFVVVVSAAIIASAQKHAAIEYRLTAGRLATALAIAASIALGFALARDFSPRTLEAGIAREFPVAAAAAVEERRYAGPLFNHYNWGGYLMWRLPGYPVSMDGRANVYGPEKIRRSAETWSGLRGWNSDPDLVRAGVVIASRQMALAELLRRDPRFDLAYEDDVATVFVARR